VLVVGSDVVIVPPVNEGVNEQCPGSYDDEDVKGDEYCCGEQDLWGHIVMVELLARHWQWL